MPASRDHGLWIHPKWLVSGVALAAFGLILSFDLRLGLAFGALLAVVLAGWLYVALRFGSLSGKPASGRQALVARFQRQTSNRRRAVLQTAKTADAATSRTSVGSGPQQAPQPPKRP
jgi:hypothetical protein